MRDLEAGWGHCPITVDIRGFRAAAARAPSVVLRPVGGKPARALEIVHVPSGSGPGSLSIFSTMIDFQPTTCLEERYRKWSLVDVGAGWSPSGAGEPRARNVELRRAVPKGVSLGGVGKTKIETETTLVGR